ncbi:nitronate monooxygenase [Halorubrum sp. CSM-61]|jgi:NAD(P)H-dependent flavin oxidoreductase YrpB (nitropropane dioxygenase family)|uniref:nitronate monooxygenase n=1 Tax=Halorubrum sp. CSM-61 TaxID=2485838 RepID=UPI000F4C20F0
MCISTPPCVRLGIDHPIVQAPIESATRPELAAAVSNAGGFGTLAITWRPPEEAATFVERTRELTRAVTLLSATVMASRWLVSMVILRRLPSMQDRAAA